MVSLLFTILFGVAATIIFVLFSNFRKEEFKDHLEEKALSSLKLLVNVTEVDDQLLKIIHQNMVNKLYDEKIVIFDANYKLIYSSVDSAKVNWTPGDFTYLKKNKTFFKSDGTSETYGVFYDTNQKDYYALISGIDSFGYRKLDYLLYILLITYFIFTAICWIVTYYTIKKTMHPLDVFHNNIKDINENSLDSRLTIKSNDNEIDLIAKEFNMMMERIDNSYQKQKEFTAHASHELRTPIARLISQIENKISNTETSDAVKAFLKNLLADIEQLSELINSLLILSKLDNKKIDQQETFRLDEIIYSCMEKLNKTYPNFQLFLDIENNENMDKVMEIRCSKPLLEIAIINVLKNAYLYSDNQQTNITLSQQESNLILTILNTGQTLSGEEQKNLFQPFMRGKNGKGVFGMGLGLRIVQRILLLHKGNISYTIPKENTNSFQIIFYH